jgi:UDP:flavonoid glycosyltransferase YjiC (YdhE family)
MAPAQRRRVLFVAEAVTLAHVARPFALAQGLDPARYDVVLACDPRYRALLGALTFPLRPIQSIPSQRFLDALSQGRPLYDAATLRGYVREDLELIAETAPELIVGDFRLSLAVSARVSGVPYVAIANVYWSPYARLRFPVPELPMTKWLGVALAQRIFGLVRPLAFAVHTLPLNRIRREFGLPSLGFDLRRVYTEADQTLYADVPDFVPMVALPAHHHFLGPIPWSPTVALPPWWDDLPRNRNAPVIYVTLGSSGRSNLLPVVLEALAGLPVTVMAATAGRVDVSTVPANARVAAFLPGAEAAALACLVICNGGSPTTQQALAAGKPVLGLVSNLDQHLNMGAVADHRAGVLVRAETATVASLRAAVERMLDKASYGAAAARLAGSFAACDAPTRFQAILAQVLGAGRPGPAPAAVPAGPAAGVPAACDPTCRDGHSG